MGVNVTRQYGIFICLINNNTKLRQINKMVHFVLSSLYILITYSLLIGRPSFYFLLLAFLTCLTFIFVFPAYNSRGLVRHNAKSQERRKSIAIALLTNNLNLFTLTLNNIITLTTITTSNLGNLIAGMDWGSQLTLYSTFLPSYNTLVVKYYNLPPAL